METPCFKKLKRHIQTRHKNLSSYISCLPVSASCICQAFSNCVGIMGKQIRCFMARLPIVQLVLHSGQGCKFQRNIQCLLFCPKVQKLLFYTFSSQRVIVTRIYDAPLKSKTPSFKKQEIKDWNIFRKWEANGKTIQKGILKLSLKMNRL